MAFGTAYFIACLIHAVPWYVGSNSNGTIDSRLYVQQDANWNVTALLAGTTNLGSLGSVQERFAYESYGAVTNLKADFSPEDLGIDPYGMPYLWQGMEMDLQTNVQLGPQTGQLYFSEDGRIFSTQLSTWLQTDPSGLSAGTNEYEGMGNAPTDATDPSGLDPNPMNLADYRCAQCHGSLNGGFKNLASGLETYRWTDLSREQQNMLALQSTYRAGVGERVVTRIINGTLLAPANVLPGLANSTRQGIEEGVPFPIVVAGSPFHLIASSIQGLGASSYRIGTGDGQAEDYVDVGLAALPYLPKLAKAAAAMEFVGPPAPSNGRISLPIVEDTVAQRIRLEFAGRNLAKSMAEGQSNNMRGPVLTVLEDNLLPGDILHGQNLLEVPQPLDPILAGRLKDLL